MKKPIPYGRQKIDQDDIDAVVDVLKSDFLTQGPKINEFEQAFAEYIGAKYAVAVSNGTVALHVSCLALQVKPGDHVITSPITFVASANCVLYCGGKILFADIDADSYLLDLNKVEDLLKSRENVQGIIPVDLAGYPVNMQECRTLAEKYNLWIIEDACHAPGGYFYDSNGMEQKCGNGNFADLAIFSFHPVKHIATGEGGMITTNSGELYKKLLLYRNNGITKSPEMLIKNDGGWYYEMQELGYNYRITDIQSALGLSQLKKADNNLGRRRQIAEKYDKSLKDLPLKLPAVKNNYLHAYHLYIIQTDQRNKLYDFLRTKNIFTQVHYIPVHLQPYYKKQGWATGDLPVAEEYYQKCLSLPIYPSLKDEEQDYVIGCLKNFFK